MSDAQYRNALNDLEHNSQNDILGAPKITTLSGRQAHIASTDSDGNLLKRFGCHTDSRPGRLCNRNYGRIASVKEG